MDSTKSSSAELVEEPLGWSSDEAQDRNRGVSSDAENFNSEKSFRTGHRIERPSDSDFRESLRNWLGRESSLGGGSDSDKSLHSRNRIMASERDFEEGLRNWLRTKNSSESGSEKSRTRSFSESDPLKRVRSWLRRRSLRWRRGAETDSGRSFSFRATEKSLRSDGEGTRSHQARMAKRMWDKDVIGRVSLYRAALMGEWEVAKSIFNQDSGAIASKITLLNETALHIVVGTGDHLGFVERLVNLMCERSLPLTQVDVYGNTALAVAAIVGNVKAAEILVREDEMLPSIKNGVDYSPLHLAAKYGHKDMISYLLSVTKDEELFIGKAGARLLNLLITFDIYDVALVVLNRQPKLAIEKDQYGVTALQMLAQKPDVFESRSQLGFWQCLLYRCRCVVMKIFDAPSPIQHGDVENPPERSRTTDSTGALYRLLTSIRLTTFRNLVAAPYLKHVNDTKCMHVQACKLVRRLCEEALNMGGKKCANLFSTSILSAAKMGTLEVATEIIRVYPYSIWFRDSRECNIFQLAVLHRQEKIYNLIYQMTSHKHFAAAFLDKFDNNILHLAGELAPSDTISGAALQLQRELQWFKEVERLVQPSYRTMKNEEGRTPRMVFSEEHELLVHRGEKWMKVTASSCTVVAALVATVAFAAVFTAPGGNSNDQGIPILVHRKSFMVFAATDALALITSSISVMMFLGILTSRYSEDDFLKSLPTRLIIGLVSLFLSISSMVAAFSASLYLVLAHQVQWVWVPIIIFAFVPVVLFAMLQFPLLVEIISSTYGRSIFGLQSKEILH